MFLKSKDMRIKPRSMRANVRYEDFNGTDAAHTAGVADDLGRLRQQDGVISARRAFSYSSPTPLVSYHA